jgi:BMFP domain-containing protein YqiC
MMLLHKSLFASKWMQAMRSALGATFAGDNSFALLYVMYNPVCRRDILHKKRLANQMLAEAMLPLALEYAGRSKGLGFYMKSSWVVLKFAIRNRRLADCNPTLVLNACKHAHAAIFRDLNRILLLVQNSKRDARTNWSTAKNNILAKTRVAQALSNTPFYIKGRQTAVGAGNAYGNDVPKLPSQTLRSHVSWLNQIRNCWTRSNKVAPSAAENQQRQDDAPKWFVRVFELKRAFVEENIDEEARLSLLTLMIFPDDEDFGTLRDCKAYKKQFDENLSSFRHAFRTLFQLSKELKSVDSSEKLMRLTLKERMFQRISDVIFGEDMKLLRNFHWLADEEADDLFKRYRFPELETGCERIPSVDDVLKQLLANHTANGVDESNIDRLCQAPKIANENMFPSTIMTFAPAVQFASERCADQVIAADPHATALRVIESVPHMTSEVPPPNSAKSRPNMYSSRSLLAAARHSDSSSPCNDAVSTRILASEDSNVSATLLSTRAENAILVERVKKLEADIASVNAVAKDAESQRRVEAAEGNMRALNAQLADLPSFSASEDTKCEDAAMITELHAARAENMALVERVKSLEARESELLDRAKAAEDALSALTVQATDSQTASGAEMRSSPSAEIASLISDLESAKACSLAAIRRANEAEEELRFLKSKMKECAAASDAASDPAMNLQGLHKTIEFSHLDRQSDAENDNETLGAEAEMGRNALGKCIDMSPDVNAEFSTANVSACVDGRTSGGTAAANRFPKLPPPQATQHAMQYSQISSWKQLFVRARKSPSPFKEVIFNNFVE